MTRIAIDARQYTTSTGRYTYRLIEYLEKIDRDHDYIILLKPEDMDVYPFTNPRFTKLACPYKEFTFDEQLKFLRQLYSLGADLVHFSMTQQPILYPGTSVTTMHDLTTIRFKNPAKNPLVFTAKQQVYKLVNIVVARKSSKVIVPSQFVKDDVVAYTHVHPDKVVVTYESADSIQDAPEAIEALAGKRFIMYLGRPQPHKNLSRLIDAFATLKQSHPDLQLVLAGKKDDLYQLHEQEAAAKGISGIYFTGFVSEGQLRWLYENCTAYVFPSLSEGFGLPGLEAMRHGAPVVSSNATCLPEIYGEAAHYFDPLDTAATAGAINKVLTDQALRQDLIDRGRRRAEDFSWERMARQTLAVYTSMLYE